MIHMHIKIWGKNLQKFNSPCSLLGQCYQYCNITYVYIINKNISLGPTFQSSYYTILLLLFVKQHVVTVKEDPAVALTTLF